MLSKPFPKVNRTIAGPLMALFLVMLPAGASMLLPTSGQWHGAQDATRAQGTWTVLSYMNGDNNLESDMIGDLEEMERIGAIASVNIVVQLDRHPSYDTSNGDWSDTRRFLVADHPAPGIGSLRLDTTPLGELNMDDPGVLRDFIEFGLTNYPAEHYMLVLEGHASGPAKGIMKDDSSTLGGSLEMEAHDMGASIRAAVDSTIGRPLDVISLDVCWMGMVETAFEVMDHSRYLIGSFDEIPRQGWPYDVCLPLIINSTEPLEDRLPAVIEAFMGSYDPNGSHSYASLAAVDLASFKQDFANVFSRLAEEMMYSTRSHSDSYSSIMSRVDTPRLRSNSANDRYIDLYQFLEGLVYDGSVPSRVRALASELGRTEGSVLIGSMGGANHPAASRLFGIYSPTVSEEALYQWNVLSALTAWDEFLIMSVRGLVLDPVRVNWTPEDPGQVTFLLQSSTPSLITKVEVETSPLGGGPTKRTLLSKSGQSYSIGMDTSGSPGLLYRYVVRTVWGSDVRLPPTEPEEVRFTSDDGPPIMLHIPPAVLDPSRPTGQIELFVSDGTGVDTTTEGAPILEYREKGAAGWSTSRLRAGAYERLRGLQTFTGFPSGIPPGAKVEYHFIASDVLGNTARSPSTGEFESTMFMGERFVLDGARSDLSGFGDLISLFNSLGISFMTDSGGDLEGLGDSKGYVLLDPSSPVDPATAEEVGDFHMQGGVVLLVMDPTDEDQVSMASLLLDELGITVSTGGRVDGYYPVNPSSEIEGPLPSLYGKSTGSFEPAFGEVNGQVPIYYSAPPLAAAMTGWNGKGRFLACISPLLADPSLEKGSNRQFAEMSLSYLARNIPPVVSVEVSPGTLVGPGDELMFDLGGSYDRDGEIVSYRLIASDGTSTGGTSHVISHTFMSSGTYDVELAVEDDGGAISKSSIVIKVNRHPETDHGISPVEIYSGTKVTFDLKGKDPDGDPVQVIWSFGDGFVHSGEKVDHVYTMRGTYRYSVKVTDSNGLVSSDEGTIVVRNSDPVAIMDREGIKVNGRPGNFSGPSMITLLVSEGDLVEIPSTGSYDRDKGEVLGYRWEMGDGSVHEGYGPDAKTIVHRYYVSGPRTVVLNITDGAGASTLAQLSIMVYNTYPAADVDATADSSGRVSFDASATLDDPWDKENMTYRWDLGDGTVRTTTSPYLEHDYGFGGRYRVKLTATDPDGDSSTMAIDVDVPGITLLQTVLLILLVIFIIAGAAAFGLYHLDRRLRSEGHGLLDLLRGREGAPVRTPSSRGFSQMERRPITEGMRPMRPTGPGRGPKN